MLKSPLWGQTKTIFLEGGLFIRDKLLPGKHFYK